MSDVVVIGNGKAIASSALSERETRENVEMLEAARVLDNASEPIDELHALVGAVNYFDSLSDRGFTAWAALGREADRLAAKG